MQRQPLFRALALTRAAGRRGLSAAAKGGGVSADAAAAPPTRAADADEPSPSPLPPRVPAFGASGARRGDWFSAAAVEARLSAPRRRARGAGADGADAPAPARTPPPTDEEAWAAAGAPGYGAGAAALSPARPAWAPRAAPSPLEAALGGLADAAAGRNCLVRVSSGGVARARLAAFVRTYELLALPAYRDSDGCLSARLLVDELEREGADEEPEAEAEGEAERRAAATAEGGGAAAASSAPAAAAAAAAPGGSAYGALVPVTSVTEWTSREALMAAQGRREYGEAMRALGEFFAGRPPEARELVQRAAHDARWRGPAPAAAATE